MTRGIRRGMVAALVGATVALSGAAAAVAAPADAPFTITATDMTYGQPSLNGTRFAENTVTYTNISAEVITFPTLTFPVNGRDDAVHADWSGCPFMSFDGENIVCVGRPIQPGATDSLTLPWMTRERPPGGTARVRIEKGLDRTGTVAPGTASRATWRVSFERLTGTFDITATDLVYGPEVDGVRRGSTDVTITNLTRKAVPYPLVTFPSSAGDAEHTLWSDCPVVLGRPDRIVCVAEPLPAGASRTLTFPFLAEFPGTEFEANVRVDAGADREGTVIEGTAAGTQYTVVYGG
ncbi:hypothetical protein [Actinoplanes sp. NBRC 103695]|uniref:hypothetical protein n=1 Tax=Actinoplanes sp. NBRC 103695 TaxID=3032202 RepID=UPI0024A141ED|nr:hypothetical protein [Actinoplanes sp. NBRC 103695]GLY93055.1 hypothetical protein Acsp02_03110 [Actinoplanes sp. NBRC 103695]